MRGRLIAIGFCVASLFALAVGTIVPACYSPPQPACGFVCGPGGACPENYTCAPTLDNRCHLDSLPMTSCEIVDAGVGVEGVPGDAPPDAPPDVFEPIDAMPDGMVDGPVVDGPVVDGPVVDGPLPDAAVDSAVTPDAMVDAAVTPDAMVDAAVTPDAMVDAAVMVDASQDAPDDAIVPD